MCVWVCVCENGISQNETVYHHVPLRSTKIVILGVSHFQTQLYNISPSLVGQVIPSIPSRLRPCSSINTRSHRPAGWLLHLPALVKSAGGFFAWFNPHNQTGSPKEIDETRWTSKKNDVQYILNIEDFFNWIGGCHLNMVLRCPADSFCWGESTNYI